MPANTWRVKFHHQNTRQDGYEAHLSGGVFPPNGYGPARLHRAMSAEWT